MRYRETFYHTEILKRFDVVELLDRKLPVEAELSAAEKDLIRVIKNAMVLTERETDTTTYMLENSVHAISSGTGRVGGHLWYAANRKLPMESFMAIPCSGTDILSPIPADMFITGQIRLNISEQYRGGELAYMVAQVRVYRQVF